MTFQEIQKAQLIGSNYANDNYSFVFEEGMTEKQFAQAALDHYNASAEAFGSDHLPEEQEKDFLFGAKQSFR
jgi:hypothetical protein